MTLRSITLPLLTLPLLTLPLLAVTATACLGQRVGDTPGASAHLLPSTAAVPLVTENVELTDKIKLNDGIDDRALVADGVLARGTGASARTEVRYWLLGAATTAPAPIYQLYEEDGTLVAGHPALVDAVPGDPGYSPLHTINKVVVIRGSGKYEDQRITTIEALSDAIDLGYASEPVPIGAFVATPIVLPEVRLEVGDGASAAPEIVYARGYQVGMFRFGGDLGLQPGGQLLPTRQVSYLRGARGATYDVNRPIFQATIPTEPAGQMVTYTPLSVVINVDLIDGVEPATIMDDDQLFERQTTTGAILETRSIVTRFQITTSIQLLQLQFKDGSL